MSTGLRGLRQAAGLLIVFALLALCLQDSFRPSNSMRASAAAAPVQLVRLSISNETGMVRLEVTADGSLGEATIEQFSRGRETVVRIRGARSLLRPSYEISDELARSVRTIAGERDGEPFVDVIIALGDGATVAQRKIFNRLVIGIASDFARLRRRSPSAGNAEVARAAQPQTKQTAAPSTINRVNPENNSRAATQVAASETVVESQAVNSIAMRPAGTSLIATAASQPVFRGRTIWGELPEAQYSFQKINPYAMAFFFQTPQNAIIPPFIASTRFAPFTLAAPGAPQGVWIPGTTTAATDEVGGKALGPGVLRPSFQFGGTFDDNFFYRSQTGRDIGVFGVTPRLEYEIPGELRAMRIAYDAQIRRLSNGQWANGHKLDFDSRVELSRFLTLSVRDHFVRSPLDPREYDPAGEVYIVGDTFWRNDGGVRLEYQFDERNRIATTGSYNIVRWSEDHIAAAPLFINYDELTLDAAYERELSEQTTGTATVTYGQTDTSVPFRSLLENLNNRRRYALEFGLRRRMSQTSGLAAQVGYERSLFYNAPRENNFSGLIFNLLFRQELSAGTNFELAALRKTQVSAFNLEGGNVRLVSTGGAARLEQALRGSLKVALGLNYQQLGFPVAVVADSTASGGVAVGNFAGERRKDHLYGFCVETSYGWNEYLRSRFVYNFSRRDSTIPVFTFNRHSLSLVFDLGRRNDVRGRPF